MEKISRVWKTETQSPEETHALAKRMAQTARPGDILTLDGDLGVGKTVFAKGFAEGLGIAEPVTSPTFTLVQEYGSGTLPLYHFDAYRVADPEEMAEIGFDEYLFGSGVCLIEWAELIDAWIPETAVRIRICKDNEKGFDCRRITVICPADSPYGEVLK